MKKITVLFFAGLILIGCRVNSNAKSKDTPGEILIDLKEGVEIDSFSAKLKKYQLKKNKVVSPGMNIVLFDFNQGKIEVEELIEKVKKMEEVENAQTNKKISPRG